MHRRSFPIVLVIVVLSVFLLFSCDNELEPPPKGFSTPTIVGRVSLPEGSGLSPNDIWIKIIEDETTKYVGKAGSDGSFAVSGLDASKKYDVLFTSIEPEQMNYSRALESKAAEDTEGYGGWLNQVSAAINEGNDVGSVKMKPMGTIKGVALIDGESEHYDITVYVPGTSFIARTAADGSFSMFNVPQGTYRLRYTLASHVSVMSDEFIMTSGGSETEHPITTVPTVILISDSGTVEGIATLDGAVDNSGIIIKLEKDDLSYSYAATTSENGSFKINGVRPGSYRLLASYAGYPTQTSNYFAVFVATTTTVPESLVLYENVGGISGSASLADNAMVKAGIMIICRNLDTDIAYSTVTNEEGVFQRVLPSGNYGITASYPGYSSQTAEVEVLMGGSSTVTLAALVSADGAVSGRIVLDGALDSSGAVVTVTCASDSSITRNAVTDINGVFRIYGLSKAGQYYIDASKEGFLSSSSAVDVSLGTVAEASVITLKSRMSKISGTVTLAGTTNHTGINVLIKAKDNSRQYDATTAQDGTYVMASVLPGVYDLYASKAGYESKASADITIEPSSVKTIDSISLVMAQRSIYGNVQLELRSDHAGALVTATKTSDPDKVYSAISNSAGDYSLAGMEPGEYRIVITSSGYRTLTLPTTDVIASSTANLETTDLIIARGTISGIVTLEGRSSQEGTRVELLGTGYETVTNELGEYSFSVPQGNYPGGIRFTKTDFKAGSYADTIPVLTDSTFAVPDTSLKATHASMEGNVTVLGTTDASGVVVSIEGTGFSMTTPSDGSYRFDHIPLGSYTIRFSYVNTPLMTASVILGAVESVTIAPMSMRPDQASIKGFASLKDLTSYAGIEVKVVNTETNELLSTRTSADGSFHIGGILTTGAYTVEFSKPGWDGQSLSVTGLTPLEERDITASQTIELVDTTDPLLTGVSINDGGNTTSNPTVSLKIEAYEQGSGIRKMRVSWDGTFDTESWIAYSAIAESTITNASNGDKTVSVQIEDLAGNRASATANATITLTDQVKAVSGILEAGELHWTKADSPILIAGDVIVNTGDTLVIDPGVDVQFNGSYAISIRGTLKAIGTAEEAIVFKPAYDRDYLGTWLGIDAGSNTLEINDKDLNYSIKDGSILQYVRIIEPKIGLTGRLFVKDSYISSSDGFALGGESVHFQGYSVGNEIHGSISTNQAFMFNNKIIGNKGTFKSDDDTIINNLITGFESVQLTQARRFEFNTLENIVHLIPLWDYSNDYSPMNNTLTEIENSIILYESPHSVFREMLFSNIYNNLGDPEIIVNAGYRELSRHNWRYNYWGEEHTNELIFLSSKGRNDASFIHDAYDDYNLSALDYSGFVTEPWEFAGYQGDGFIDFSASFLSKAQNGINEAKIAQPIEFSLEMLTGSNVSKFRMGQSIEQLKTSAWKNFSGVASLASVDTALLRDGFVDLIIQVMDDEGYISALKTLSVGYEAPKFTEINIADGTRYTSTDTPMSVKTKITDNVYAYGYRIKLGDQILIDEGGWYGERHEFNHQFDISRNKNGEYLITFEIGDLAGNKTTATRSIIIDRPVPHASNMVFTNGTTIGEGESLEFSINISQAAHLKTLRVLANGNEMKKVSYVDNGQSSFTYSASISSVYIPNGESSLSLELTDYADNVASYDLGTFMVGGIGMSPTIKEVSIADGTAFTSLTDTNLSFTASDTGGVRLVRALLNGEEIRPSYALPYNDVLRERKISWPMNIPYRKNGTYTLAIEATDFAGYKTVDERTITIDRVIPTAWFTMNGNNLLDSDTFTVSYSIQNAQSLAYFELLIDGHQLQYDGYHGLAIERNYASGSWSWDVENLPAGTHDVTMRIVDIAGNETVTAAQQIVVYRTVMDSDYGLGLTWDTDGTLLQDWSTHYLWDFDNPSARGLDTAGGVLNGDVRQTTEGLGGTAARFYIYQDVETQFPDASWTVEYWAKMEHISTYSHFTFGLENVFSTDIIKSSTTNHSYSNSYFIYQTPAGIDLSQASVQGYTSRENRSEWHHYAWVSTGNGLFFYIDGLLVAKLEDKMSNILATRVYIYSDYIDNFMDEIRISMRARSVDELWSYVQYAKEFLPNE